MKYGMDFFTIFERKKLNKMKFVTSQLSFFYQNRVARRNIKYLVKYLLSLFMMIIVYSILFHYISDWEGTEHSWITGFYWTLTVMSTLGFGDITFTSDLGKIFSIIVLLSGVIFLLVILPFTFIQFFYAPWLQAQTNSRTPRELPQGTKNHVIFTAFSPIAESLIGKLQPYGIEYVILQEDSQKAIELYDNGYKVAIGNLDDPLTYSKMRVEESAIVVVNSVDEINTNSIATIREVTETVPVISLAHNEDSVDILQLAGSTLVYHISKRLGEAMARRTIGFDASANIIGKFDNLLIAEALATGTPLVNKTVAECKLKETTGLTIIGIWDRGVFINARPETIIQNTSLIALAGTEDQMNLYNELFCIYHASDFPVIIIGCGRVGTAIAKAFELKGINYRIVDKDPSKIVYPEKTITGYASDISILEKAGIRNAPAVIITTHDDATNIYLTIYCRRLRPDMQIISRASLDRNISTLNRAGSDLVISYASLGANYILNYLTRKETVMIAEGLFIFELKTPSILYGLKLAESNVRQETGCSIIAVKSEKGIIINPEGDYTLQPEDNLILIGSSEGEKKFYELFMNSTNGNNRKNSKK